jgi:hypothetical protein
MAESAIAPVGITAAEKEKGKSTARNGCAT